MACPCINGGTCADFGVGLDNVECKCRPGITARIQFAAPASNWHILHVRSHVRHVPLTCLPPLRAGYIGVRCQDDINECTSNPCMNDGLCTDFEDAYECNCIPGYTGNQCELLQGEERHGGMHRDLSAVDGALARARKYARSTHSRAKTQTHTVKHVLARALLRTFAHVFACIAALEDEPRAAHREREQYTQAYGMGTEWGDAATLQEVSTVACPRSSTAPKLAMAGRRHLCPCVLSAVSSNRLVHMVVPVQTAERWASIQVPLALHRAMLACSRLRLPLGGLSKAWRAEICVLPVLPHFSPRRSLPGAMGGTMATTCGLRT